MGKGKGCIREILFIGKGRFGWGNRVGLMVLMSVGAF